MRKIFIIHGWTYSLDKWKELIEKLSSVGFDVHTLHVPGLTEDTNKVWTLEDYVEWLHAKLEHETEPVVIGHSNGGRIALAFAVRYPDKLKHLILIDSAGIYPKNFSVRLKRFIFGTAARVGKKITSSETIRNIMYKLARESDYKNATPQMRETMANLIKVDLLGILDQIQAPVLIIWGGKDKLTPLSDGQKMHSLIKDSKLFMIPDAGHSPHFTNADEVCKKILEEVQP